LGKVIAVLALLFGLAPTDGITAPSATLPMVDDGVMLKIPAVVFDQSHNFVVDSGCSTTILDPLLAKRLGAPKGQKIAEALYHSDLTLNVYAAPNIRVGAMVLPVTTVAEANLRMARLISGDECSGVLGMDVLSQYVVTLDFSREQFYLSSEAPSAESVDSTSVPMIALGGGHYGVAAVLNDSHRLTLSIDSGTSTSISLNRQDWKTVFGNDSQRIGRISCFTGLGNSVQVNQTVRLKSLRIGSNLYRNLLCTCLPNPSSASRIGLGLLRRNLVTLDFPNKRLQLIERSQMPQEQDDMSGLHLLRENGAVTVYAVDLGSPADRAGIKVGDQILSLNGERSIQLKMQQIRYILQQQDGMKIEVALNREGKSFSTVLMLKSLI